MFGLMLAVALAANSMAMSGGAAEQGDMSLPPPEQVLAIPEKLREEFRRKVMTAKSPEQRMYKLVDFMLKPEGLSLQYAPDATNTVAESYRTRKVNCMAFTIMAVALAREAGLTAHAQQIDQIMAWDMTGDVVRQSLHANAVIEAGSRKFMLDIAVGRLAQPVTDYQISDEHLLALFYGNRAMELLIAGQLDAAKAWQDEALRLEQGDATLWNNAGVLRQRLGDSRTAELLYLKAVERNPQLNSALANLVELYRGRGDLRQVHLWQQRSERVLRRDPYYQFAQGQSDELAGNYPAAIRQYQRAISLRRNEQVFHFFLARAYYQSGQMREASDQLTIAQQLSNGADRQRYQAKQEALRRLGY